MNTRCAFLLLGTLCVARAQNATGLTAQLGQIVDRAFPGTRCPGLSVTVAKGNETIYSSASGYADLEGGVRLTKSSVQRLASVSKPVTGTIIMDLVRQGKLILDRPVRTYLPELPPTYAEITLRQLLDHQSGVVEESLEIFFDMTHYSTSRSAMKVFLDAPLKFKPGTATEYGSQGFTLAGAVAEAVTGKSFQRLSADFFAAHGLRGFFLDDNFAVVPNRVRGYLVDRESKIELQDGTASSREYLEGTEGATTNAKAYDISARYPAGGFDASGEDLMQFVLAVGSGRVLPPALLEEMWSAQKTKDVADTVFGIGWGVSKRNERVMVGMNGGEPSTTTMLRYFPKEGIGVALLCNAEGAQNLSSLLDELLDATLK